MAEQWGNPYGQQMMMTGAGGQQQQFVVCMMPCYVQGGQGQAMAAGQPFAFQQADGSMQQMWMTPQMMQAQGMQAAVQGGDDSRSRSGAAVAAGARQSAGFQQTAQASGAAASGGKEATVFDPSVASFVPQAQQQQAQQGAADGSHGGFQMSAGAKAFDPPPVDQRRTQQGMANGRFQGASDWSQSKDRQTLGALNLEAAGAARFAAPKRALQKPGTRADFAGLGRHTGSSEEASRPQDAAAGGPGLGPSAGWGMAHAQGAAATAEHAQPAAAPAPRPNAADARGWTRTPKGADAVDARGWTQGAPSYPTPGRAAVDPMAKGAGKGKGGGLPAGSIAAAGVGVTESMDAASPLHRNREGKAYVPPHLRNRPAPQGAQDAPKKEEPKKEEEPKPLEAAEFPSLISAVAPKKIAKAKTGPIAFKEVDAEPAPAAAQKPEERKEPVLKGTAWGKDAAKEREEAAKKRKEEDARAAQEAAEAAEAAARKAAEEQEQRALQEAAEPSSSAAQLAEPAEPRAGGASLAAAPSAEHAEPLEEIEEEAADEAPAGQEETAAAEEDEAAPELEASERAADAKGDGKGGGELAAEEAANVETNDEGGETNGEETNDEAGRPETDVSAPDADADAPPQEEAKAEKASQPTAEEPPAAEEAPQELATGVLGGIFASKGKKKLKNLAAPKPAGKDDAARAAEEAAAAERARLEEEEAERERRRAEEEAAERAREEEAREEEARRRAEEAKELERASEDREPADAEARETGEEDLDEDEEDEDEEGTEDMEAATDEVEMASADGEAVSDDGEEHPSPHAQLLAYRSCGDGEEPPKEVATLSAKEDPAGWKPEDMPKGLSKAGSQTWRRSAEVERDRRPGDRGDRRDRDRDRDRKGGGRSGGDWERPPRENLSALANRAEHAYKRNTDDLDREAELRRCAKSLLNKICPDNCSTIAKRIATEAMVKTEEELEIVIHLIFQKALAEPHYCETYVELVHALKGEMPEFPKADGGKPLTFKAALLNVTQEEYEAMTSNTLQPTEEEKANLSNPEELRFLMDNKKKKLLANMKFIGHLYLKELLGGKVITSVASELLKIDGSGGLPEEHVVECVCELISSIGYTLDNSKFQSVLVSVCSRLKDLKGQKNKAGKDILSKRIQFQIQDLLDMRQNNWAKKTFKAAAKTKEEIRMDAERDERMKERGKEVPTAEIVIAGKKTATAKDAGSIASASQDGAWDVVKNKGRR